MWQNFHRGPSGTVYTAFFTLLTDVYGEGNARLTVPKPLFETFQLGEGKDSIQVHQIYNVRHDPPDIDKAVQTISAEHNYVARGNLDIPETESSKGISAPSSSQPCIPETPPDAAADRPGPSRLAPASRPGIRHVFMPVGFAK